MINVFQTKKHNPPTSRGNCFAACIASILEISIDDVPPIEDIHDFNDKEAGTDVFRKVLATWLKSRGLAARQYDVPESIAHRHAPIGYAIGTAPSPRGPWLHSCVFLHGELVHDPAGPDVTPINPADIVDWIKLEPIFDEGIGLCTKKEIE